MNSLSSYYCVGEEELSRLRARFDTWAHTGFNNGDVLIIPIVELINKLPGVVSVFSCQGHESLPSQPNSVRNFDLQLCTNTEGFVWVMDLFARVRERLEVVYPLLPGPQRKVHCVVRQNDLRIEIGRFGDPFRRPERNSMILHPRICLRADTTMIDEAERERFCAHWTRVLHEMLRELNPKENADG